jgi:hypothetical protein
VAPRPVDVSYPGFFQTLATLTRAD